MLGRAPAPASSEAWIVKGLKDGDRVIVYPPRPVRDGARVRARSV